MAEKSGSKGSDARAGVGRLREEHHKVVTDFEGQIQHWKKVSGDYEALDDRLHTLPDQLSYDIMVPFGPLAFMPGKLVHTNEVTVLLGDNWFAKCSAKQAQKIVDHRRKYVKCELDGLLKLRKNFEAKVDFTKGLENLSASKGNYVDIREEVTSNDAFVTKGKHRVAHKPHSEPKLDAVLHLEEEEEQQQQQEEEDGGSRKGILSEEELWARLDELEKLEEQQDEQDRLSDATDTNGDDTSSSSSSSEEEKEQDTTRPQNRVRPEPSWSPTPSGCRVNNRAIPEKEEGDDDDEEEDGNCLPTIYFSHTVEPKKVRINTGKNTMLKYSERKEQNSKRKKKNGGGSSNGHAHHELHRITTPTDIYRLFVDVRNGEPIPRKSILKSRSRENSVCSDTSESSAADMEERRLACRSHSHDEATHSDTSDGVTEESDCPAVPLPHPASRYQAFSGTVVEKDPMPSAVPHLTIAPPALPTIPEWKQEEVASDVAPPQEPPKRVSKFKAARLQQK